MKIPSERGQTSRLALHALALSLILIAFIALLTAELFASRKHELDRAKIELSSRAELLSNHIADRVVLVDNVLAEVARQYPNWRHWPDEAIHRELATYLASIPDSQSLRIGNPEGKIVFDATGKPPAISIFDRDYVRRLRENPDAGMVLSEPIFARFTHNWVITLSRRLQSPNANENHFQGHVQAAINAERFGSLFQHVVNDPRDVVALYDNDIRLIARLPAIPEQLGKRLSGTRLEKMLAEGITAANYQAASPLDQIDRHFAMRKVRNLPLNVIVGRSEADILAPWYAKAKVYGVSSLVLAGVLLSLLWSWHRNYRQAVNYGNEMEAAFEESERRARTLLDSIPDPAWLRDSGGRFLAVNDAYLRHVGKTRTQVVGHRASEVLSERNAAESSAIESRVIASGTACEGVWQRHHADGREMTFEYVFSPLRGPDSEISGVAGFARDITPRREAEARADYLAGHDPLTDLPNRLFLSENIAQALARENAEQRRIALFLLDIDHFKRINETMGHAVGDRLLQIVADRLRETVFGKDRIVRHGGDEFAILVVDWHDPGTLAQIASRILQKISETYLIDDREYQVTASIGISLYPDDGRDIDHLLRNADAALYAAKSDGRNTFRFFETAMNSRVAARLSLETRLRRAITDGRLQLYYQPQYAASGQHCIGAEALVRWLDPDEGVILPSRFIPLAEETGLIRQIGDWVLEEACRQAARWLASGALAGTVAVNFSAAQLSSPDIIDRVRNALDHNGLPANRLEIEITESMLLDDIEHAAGVLQALRNLGVKLAIDDFGTGYSSLAYLGRLPLDKIKIDRSFVANLDQQGKEAVIIEAVIAVAGKFGLTVIAEGVETQAQVEALARLGCNELQGFFFSRPVPADMATRLISQQPLDSPH